MQADATEVSPEDALRHNAEPNESHFLLGYATPPGTFLLYTKYSREACFSESVCLYM